MILIFIDHGRLQAQNILPMYKTFSPVNMFLQSSLLAYFLKNCLRVYKGNNQPLSGFLLKLSFLVFRGVCLPIIDCSLIPTLALCMRQKNPTDICLHICPPLRTCQLQRDYRIRLTRHILYSHQSIKNWNLT